ncbi:hypothetical protein [Mesorhizobium qingshengii]|uniref:Uncharacterized protein n=1 Tax=Mesorhizobium qingshengii TaxID=1165689 RepID=A0A1G5V2F0_9HYPH|nr:hypothetical protein [Mesorhizobium qingshengii]SDA39447.1 hypothetical protein SAMN02927914_00147 [Mesorhizobium qingshengii]
MRPLVDMVKLSLAVPRGEAGFWQIILDLDKKGPWTGKQVADRTNVSRNIVNDYLRRLNLGGFTSIVEQQLKGRMGRNVRPEIVYVLAKWPQRAPRLHRDGSAIPETAKEQLWRAIRMAKQFNALDLPQLCVSDVKPATVSSYIYALVAVGVIVGKWPNYRLVRNIGSAAPKILTAKVVFDPNKNVVLGSSVVTAREASS